MIIDIPEGLEKLAHQYTTARQQELMLIASAIDRADFDQLCTLAHNLRGSGSSYGFPGITQLGDVMEISAKARDATALSQQFIQLTEYLNRAIKRMHLPT